MGTVLSTVNAAPAPRRRRVACEVGCRSRDNEMPNVPSPVTLAMVTVLNCRPRDARASMADPVLFTTMLAAVNVLVSSGVQIGHRV